VALETRVTPQWRRAQRAPRKSLVLSFLAPLSQWRNDIALVVALSVLLEVLVLLIPMQMQLSIDSALHGSDGRLVWVLAGGFGLVVLLQGAIAVVRAWTLAVFGTRVGYELKDRFVRALHRKSARFFLSTTAPTSSAAAARSTRSSRSSRRSCCRRCSTRVTSIAIVVVMLLAVPLDGRRS
jgi:ATP-binding cassette subfamily B protein RaxB